MFFGAAAPDLSKIYGSSFLVLTSDRDVQQALEGYKNADGVDIAARFVPTDSPKADCFVGFHTASGYSETSCVTSVGLVVVGAIASKKGNSPVRDDSAMTVLKAAVSHLASVRDPLAAN